LIKEKVTTPAPADEKEHIASAGLTYREIL
jgi:hypothetical protein